MTEKVSSVLKVDRNKSLLKVLPNWCGGLLYPEYELHGPPFLDLSGLPDAPSGNAKLWTDPLQDNKMGILGDVLFGTVCIMGLLPQQAGLLDLLAIKEKGLQFHIQHFGCRGIVGLKHVIWNHNKTTKHMPYLQPGAENVFLYWLDLVNFLRGDKSCLELVL
ncbi:MAG: hypothetical protein Q7K54_04805 [Candidatus Parcubacteria bacterium]|nr:hypothetical protein [Candidatus Parcubacteria bacterium]